MADKKKFEGLEDGYHRLMDWNAPGGVQTLSKLKHLTRGRQSHGRPSASAIPPVRSLSFESAGVIEVGRSASTPSCRKFLDPSLFRSKTAVRLEFGHEALPFILWGWRHDLHPIHPSPLWLGRLQVLPHGRLCDDM